MKNDKIRPSTFSITLSIGLLFLIFILFSQWRSINDNLVCQRHSTVENKNASGRDLSSVDDKQRGAHVFGKMDTANFERWTRNNLEWITLVPWGFQDDYNSPIVTHHNGDSSQILRTNSNWLNRIALVRAAGFKVFVKPHIWVDHPTDGKWRSDIYPTNEENWESWKKSYRNFILRYAKLAEQANAEMFCIGTELSRLSVEKPLFWKILIQEVQSIYSGKITYAANWYNEYEKIDFWNKLDYVGIQAYFPLVKNKYPSVEQISKGWHNYFPVMESMYKKYNRKILFTEMGYKSTADSAIKPWEWIDETAKHKKAISIETQANCYEAFFNTVWKKEWFAGVHIWQLRNNHLEKARKGNLDFTPQGKPAEEIIAKGFE